MVYLHGIKLANFYHKNLQYLNSVQAVKILGEKHKGRPQIPINTSCNQVAHDQEKEHHLTINMFLCIVFRDEQHE